MSDPRNSPQVVVSDSAFDFDFVFVIPDQHAAVPAIGPASPPNRVDQPIHRLLTPPSKQKRSMVRAQLLGSHVHKTANGIYVRISQRRGTFLARGRMNGVGFNPSLGKNVAEAEQALRRLLTTLEDGTYVRPSDSKRRPKPASVQRISLKLLCEEFLAAKRKVRGKRTHDSLRSRLRPALHFAELPSTKRQWPNAGDIDTVFFEQLREWLFQQPVYPNGHPNADPKPRGAHNVRQVILTLGGVFRFGVKKRLLPREFEMPDFSELVPPKSVKDPNRPNPVPLADRIRMVAVMDAYELLHLLLPFVFAVRPEDFVSRLISDFDRSSATLRFYERFDGGDFSKGRTNFVLPLPEQLLPLVDQLVGHRAEGPLLRRRAVWEGSETSTFVADSLAEVESLVHLRRLREADQILCPRDVKDVVQHVVRDLGGPSVAQLRGVYAGVRQRAGLPLQRQYDLKHAITTDMTSNGVKQLAAIYFTGHRIPGRDTMPVYDSVDLRGDIHSYFEYAAPLFEAMVRRAKELGITV